MEETQERQAPARSAPTAAPASYVVLTLFTWGFLLAALVTNGSINP
ncbi:MAG TPA: hypothetical protein VEK08_16385 [Planctomycetota bacterium]|nr:hypothetical protein [Planctomycetota bacterium]